MKLKDMVLEVDNIVQDKAYDSDKIKGFINEAILYASNLVNLPDYKRIGTVQTVRSQPYVSLTDITGGFAGRIVKVSNPNIAVYSNLVLLMDYYASATNQSLTQEGDLEAVALEGSTLWYQYVPATETNITFLYYRNPSILKENSEEPPYFPEHLHRKLFIHGAAYMIFDQMEDGMEGEKINTAAQFFHSFSEDSKTSGIIKLREYLGRNRSNYISSVWSQ